MELPWWVIGVLLSLTASLFGTMGKVLMKLAHLKNENRLLFAGATLCVIVLNPVFDAWSYQYAAQSVLAPMAGFSVVWNIILSPYILKERLSEQDIHGSVIILFGCVFVGVSGSHVTPEHTPAELFGLFKETIFICYAILAILVCAMVSYNLSDIRMEINVLVCIILPHYSYHGSFILSHEIIHGGALPLEHSLV